MRNQEVKRGEVVLKHPTGSLPTALGGRAARATHLTNVSLVLSPSESDGLRSAGYISYRGRLDEVGWVEGVGTW